MEEVVEVSRPLRIGLKWIGLCRSIPRRQTPVRVPNHTGYGVGRELEVWFRTAFARDGTAHTCTVLRSFCIAGDR